MSSGRKAKFLATSTGNITNEQKEEKRRAEGMLAELEPIQVNAPNYMKGYARAEWTRMIKLISQLPISSIDKTVLETYCYSYATFREMTKDIEQRGHIILNSKSERVANPSVRIRNTAVTEMRTSLTTLGLTVPERLKMALDAVKEEESKKFDLSDL